MKNWQLIAKSSLKLTDTDGRPPVDKEVRVKIDKVLLSASDTILYEGKYNTPYPVTPGCYAVGRVSSGYGVDYVGDESSAQFPFVRNEKVILRSFFLDKDDMPVTTGVHINGYLKDFAYVPIGDLFHIPPGVSDDDALYLGFVSVAENAIDRLRAEEGDFVLVAGDDILSVIICRLLLYYKSVPILITSTDEKVARAKKAGIFYSFRTNEELKDNIYRITSGRYCDGAIYTNAINKTSPSVIMNFMRPQTNLIFVGICDRTWPIDSDILTRKALNISALYTGYGYEKIALNLLTGKLINFGAFERESVPFANLPSAYESLIKKNKTGYAVDIINIF